MEDDVGGPCVDKDRVSSDDKERMMMMQQDEEDAEGDAQKTASAVATATGEQLMAKQNVVRLMLRSLYDMGNIKAAKALEEESGLQVQSEEVSQLSHAMVAGQWDEAIATLKTLPFKSDQAVMEAEVLILQEVYMEMLEKGQVEEALLYLQGPLKKALNVEEPTVMMRGRLHTLAAFMMCPDALTLRSVSGWLGVDQGSREAALANVQALLPPWHCIPQGQLERLLGHAVEHANKQAIHSDQLNDIPCLGAIGFSAAKAGWPRNNIDTRITFTRSESGSGGGGYAFLTKKARPMAFGGIFMPGDGAGGGGGCGSGGCGSGGADCGKSACTECGRVRSRCLLAGGRGAGGAFAITGGVRGQWHCGGYTNTYRGYGDGSGGSGGGGGVDYSQGIQGPPDVLPNFSSKALEGHEEEVWCLSFSNSTGSMLATGSSDCVIIIWDMHKLEAIQTFRGLQFAPHTLAWSPNDLAILCCGDDPHIEALDVIGGTVLKSCASHNEAVTSVTWLPDGSGFVSAGLDRKIVIWSLYGEVLAMWHCAGQRITSLALSSGGDFMYAVCGECNLRSFSIKRYSVVDVEDLDHDVGSDVRRRRWRTGSGRGISSSNGGDGGGVGDDDVNDDGIEEEVMAGDDDGDEAEALGTDGGGYGSGGVQATATEGVGVGDGTAATVTSNGTAAASSSSSRSLTLADILGQGGSLGRGSAGRGRGTGGGAEGSGSASAHSNSHSTERWVIREQSDHFYFDDSIITNICLSKDDNCLLLHLAGARVICWSTVEHRSVNEYVGHRQGRYIVRSAFGGPGDAYVVSGSEDSQVYVWRRSDGSLLAVLPGHSGTVNDVAWSSSDVNTFASVSDDSTVRIWRC